MNFILTDVYEVNGETPAFASKQLTTISNESKVIVIYLRYFYRMIIKEPLLDTTFRLSQ